ncbi:uncharacterized protein BHQ10_009742 [Talaromyces amestolkiae]|uniref:F-box domain-containing protein n=1 Tax=Talaromyces amestolkiae TaxID=1196081 RepID=A0A364LD35_TALAM|nr:uncharacterized protein BHQ10_009742 [Talaromyces amestolkiae]RAO73730.1 hypothetical protein BHQ10_009742 [Talaromyces amestolkiae]
MSFSSLPTELLQHIAYDIESLETLRALSCLNQRFYAIFDPFLYQQDACNNSSAPGSLAVAWAAEHGNLALLKKALSYGAEISLSSPYPQKRRLRPVPEERTNMRGDWAQLSAKDRPEHPLCIAVKRGHKALTEFLVVNRRCDINMRNQQGFPLLSLAVLYGHIHLIKLLLELGASSQMTDDYYRVPICTAVVEGFERGMELLLDPKLRRDCRPSIEHMQRALESALHADEEIYSNKDNIIRILLDSGLLDGESRLDFTFRDRRKTTEIRTPLHWAVEQVNIKYLQRCLEAGADPNFPRNSVPWSIALVRAVKLKNEDMVKLLLPKTRRVQRTLALAWSIKLFAPEDDKGRNIPQILLQNGTLPDYQEGDDAFLRSGSRNTFGECTLGVEYPEELTDAPLVLAVHSGDIDLVRLLAEYGANVNVNFLEFLPSFGEVLEPLTLATKLGHLEIAQFLRDHGTVERDYMTEIQAHFVGWSYNRPAESFLAGDERVAPIPE